MVWRGEDDSKAQPDVARPARGLATIRGGPAGRAGGGARRRASRTRSERAAAGRAGPAGEVAGCGPLGWRGAGNLGKLALQDGGAEWGSAGRKRRGRSPRKGETPRLTRRGLLDWLGRPDPSGREARAGEATQASWQWGGTLAGLLRLRSVKFVPFAKLRGWG